MWGYIRAVVGIPRLRFDVTPPQLALVQHVRGFIRTIPVNSGSNDLVLDSLRYVGDTDFYTDHICFAASLPHCFTTFLRMLWLLRGLSTVEWAT